MNFKEASKAALSLPSKPDNKTLLKLYSLYKQVSDGDATGKRPGMLDVKGRAKFDAWKKLEGTSNSDAQQQYIDLVEGLKK